MKALLIAVLLASPCCVAQTVPTACVPPVDGVRVAVGSDESATVSARVNQLFNEDQAAREAFRGRPPTQDELEQLIRSDAERRTEVLGYLRAGKLAFHHDFYHAAFIFQHGNCLEHIKLAAELARQAMALADTRSARWIYAATTDRYLVLQGRPQKYGTQFSANPANEPCLYPIDPATKDEERLAYGVPPLAELLKRAGGRYCEAQRQ